jgi:SAM-dependent methyltransferase
VTLESDVAQHYGAEALEQRILQALRQAGKDPDHLGPDDLAPMDEFHSGGRASTVGFVPRLCLRAGTELLDLGSGIGGPARYFAHYHGCKVTGIDLTPEFVAVARSLTQRLGLQGRVKFQEGSILDLPFPAASFDVATLLHVGMNIADKPRLFAEVRRVLKPGSIFGIFDQMREGDDPLTFPLPWASIDSSSFVEPPSAYRQYLVAAGFEIVWERSLAAEAVAIFAQQMPAGETSPVGIHVTMGPTAQQKIANLKINTQSGTIAPTEMVAIVAA